MVKLAAAALGFLALASTVSADYYIDPWCGDDADSDAVVPKEEMAKTNEVNACIDYLYSIADHDCTAYPYAEDWSILPFCVSGSSAIVGAPVGSDDSFTKPCGTFAKAFADVVKKCARSDGLVSGGAFFTAHQSANIYNRDVTGY